MHHFRTKTFVYTGFLRAIGTNEITSICSDAPLQHAVIYEEEIAEWVESPAKAVVGARFAAVRFVLGKTAELQVRGEVQLQANAVQLLGKIGGG